MSTIDEYVQELIRAQEEQIARKIYQETIIPYLMKIQAEPKSDVENGWPQTPAEEEEPNRWPLDPEDVVVEYLGNNGSASGGSECAGTYPVSGYTRADGTEVSGYMRTCGAAHLGSNDDKSNSGKVYNDETENDLDNVELDEIDEILYKDIARLQKEREESKVLYGNVSKSDRGEELRELAREHSKIYRNYDRLMPSEKAQKALTKLPVGDKDIPMKDYYKISLELADYPEKVVSNERNNIYKAGNLPKSVDKRVVLDKISNGLKLDLNKPKDLEKAKETVVVVPTGSSKLVKVLKRSDKIRNLVKNEYKNIVNGNFEGRYLEKGLEFEKPDKKNISSFLDKTTLFGVLHNVDIYDMKQNSDGSITLVISDFFDFEHWNFNQDDDFGDIIIKYINNNANEQQKAGKLKPYMIYIPLEFKYEELKDILFRQ